MRAPGFASGRAVLLVALLGAGAACSLSVGPLSGRGGSAARAAATPVAVYATDPLALKRGRGLFIGSCGGYCHSLEPVRRDAPDLFDCVWLHGGADREIFHTISTGVPNTRMLGFGSSLPEGESDIWKLIAFLRQRSRCPS